MKTNRSTTGLEMHHLSRGGRVKSAMYGTFQDRGQRRRAVDNPEPEPQSGQKAQQLIDGFESIQPTSFDNIRQRSSVYANCI